MSLVHRYSGRTGYISLVHKYSSVDARQGAGCLPLWPKQYFIHSGGEYVMLFHSFKCADSNLQDQDAAAVGVSFHSSLGVHSAIEAGL